MRLGPDELIFWQHGLFKLNGTIVFTWALMAVLVLGSMWITRRLSTDHQRSRWQNLLEIVVTGITQQIREVGLARPERYLAFLGRISPEKRPGCSTPRSTSADNARGEQAWRREL